jgi:hypothetical protein
MALATKCTEPSVEIVVVEMGGEGELLHVVGAACSIGRFADAHDSWDQEAHKYPDDGEDDEQFQQREPWPATKRVMQSGRVPACFRVKGVRYHPPRPSMQFSDWGIEGVWIRLTLRNP